MIFQYCVINLNKKLQNIAKNMLMIAQYQRRKEEAKKLMRATDPEIWELYDKVCDWEYVRYKEAYEQINGHFVSLEENEQVRQ